MKEEITNWYTIYTSNCDQIKEEYWKNTTSQINVSGYRSIPGPISFESKVSGKEEIWNKFTDGCLFRSSFDNVRGMVSNMQQKAKRRYFNHSTLWI